MKDGFKTSAATQNKLQMLHTRGDHWITVSNIDCAPGTINVYDSAYSSVDKATENIIYHLFTNDKPCVIEVNLYQR